LWEVLPEGLKELEVYYHTEPQDTFFFRGWSDRHMYLYDIPGWWPGAHWLFELLQARKAGEINQKSGNLHAGAPSDGKCRFRACAL
jgi:hypothetical protein